MLRYLFHNDLRSQVSIFNILLVNAFDSSAILIFCACFVVACFKGSSKDASHFFDYVRHKG